MGVKEFRSRLKAAMPYLKYSAFFAARRLKRKILGYPEIDLVAIDIDFTLLDGWVTGETLELKHGQELANEVRSETITGLSKGTFDFDKSSLDLTRKVIGKGITKEDYWNAMENLELKGKIRLDLITSVKKMQMEGKHVVVVTKGSKHAADWLVERFLFDAGYGTAEDPKTNKVIELIGDNTRTLDSVQVKTKIDKLREFCNERRIQFNSERTALITDAVLDAKDMKEIGVGILFVPTNSLEFSKLAVELLTYDLLLPENKAHELRDLMSKPLPTLKRWKKEKKDRAKTFAKI